MTLFEAVRKELRAIYLELEKDVFKAPDGLIRIESAVQGFPGHMVVEFAQYGVEADNMLFDDVGIYPYETDLSEILKDLEII